MKDNLAMDLAMDGIRDILLLHDISAVVVLHVPGKTLSLVRTETPYSCVSRDGDRLKVRAKLEDFGGDTIARAKKLKETCKMLKELFNTSVNAIYPYFELSQELEHKLKDELQMAKS